MNFTATMVVRLRIDSTLLYIDSIDEEKAIAYCRKFGTIGPEGDTKLYLLDALRENVIRASRQIDTQSDYTILSKLLCSVGLHLWARTVVDNREIISNLKVKTCKKCGLVQIY